MSAVRLHCADCGHAIGDHFHINGVRGGCSMSRCDCQRYATIKTPPERPKTRGREHPSTCRCFGCVAYEAGQEAAREAARKAWEKA